MGVRERSDNAGLEQNVQALFAHAQLAAEHVLVVLADKRRTPGDAPGRGAEYGRRARVR